MTSPAIASVVPVCFSPECVIRVTFTHAMDLDHANLLDASSYRMDRTEEGQHAILVRSVEAIEVSEETYGYGDQYGYEFEPYDPDGYESWYDSTYGYEYGYYSQQTPTSVDLFCYGQPSGAYLLSLLNPLLAANGSWITSILGMLWDDGETVWDDGETVWEE